MIGRQRDVSDEERDGITGYLLDLEIRRSRSDDVRSDEVTTQMNLSLTYDLRM